MTEKKGDRLPRRDEVDPRYQWDLTQIFKSDKEWEKAFEEVKESLSQIAPYRGRLMESSHTLVDALRLRDEISEKMGKVYVYAHLKKDEDTKICRF